VKARDLTDLLLLAGTALVLGLWPRKRAAAST